MAAKLDGESKAEAAAGIEEVKKAEQLTRDRLYILQIWRKYDYETANKVAKKKNGEHDDPDLVKVLEDREKKEEKAERERARQSSQSKFKKFRSESYQNYGASTGYGSQSYDKYQGCSQRGGHRRGFSNRDWKPEGKCYTCGLTGHQFANCPGKK